MARHRHGRPTGRFAYLGFTNVWHGRHARPRLQPGQGLHDHRPAGLPARQTGAVQVLGRATPRTTSPTPPTSPARRSPSRSTIPRARRSSRRPSRPTPTAASTARSRCPRTRRSASIRSSFPNRGGGTFRVEEYKKPEFEVTVDAPKEPVHARREDRRRRSRPSTTSARPVAKAKVKYKVTRTQPTAATGIPRGRWDWLYGPGYWWFAADYAWYPGWSRVGLLRPVAVVVGPAAGSRPRSSPRTRCRSAPTARVKVEIDTAAGQGAAPRPGPQVRRSPPRSPTSRAAPSSARGDVLVARKPFQVFTWVDRGHYRAGDTIEAELPRPDARPQAGRGQGRR